MASELIAALTGGLLSLLGTVVTLWFQHRTTTNERRNIVSRFIVEQGEYLREVAGRLESNFEKHREVWMEDIEQIEAIFLIFQRNIEQLIHLEDESLRKEIRSIFSDTYYIARRARYWQTKNWEMINKIRENDNISDDERVKFQNEAVNFHVEAKNCIVDLKQKSSLIGDIRSRLDNK